MCLQYLPQHQSQHVMWSLVQRTYSFIYEFEMGLLVRSGKLSYELRFQRFNIYCVPSDILIIWWLDFSEACNIKNKAWGKWTGNLEGITWENRSATSKARWDPGAVTPALCLPMLQQGPSWEQNLEEGNYWQLFLILLYLPDNSVKTSHWWPMSLSATSGNWRGCLGRGCKPGGCLLHLDLCPQTFCICVLEGTSLLLPSHYGPCLLWVSLSSLWTCWCCLQPRHLTATISRSLSPLV